MKDIIKGGKSTGCSTETVIGKGCEEIEGVGGGITRGIVRGQKAGWITKTGG